jgi:5'-3' exonuclease
MSFSFNELETAAEGNTLIVDALNLAFRWKHQGSTDFRHEYVQTVRSFATSYKCSNIIITADEGSSRYRKIILPDYKQNRKEKYSKQTEEERLAFIEFFKEYENTMELLKEDYIVLKYPATEADDIAAFLVKKKEEFGFKKIWLISSDRDWDLLVAKDVSRFSYINRKEVTIDNWHDHYEVDSSQYACFKSLTGDKGDNVPGYNGIGPKRAANLLKEYGSAYNIYDACPLPGKYKYIEEINKNPDLILRNYELMDLITYCEEALGTNANDIRRQCGSVSTIYT